ncbi:MAG: hypothetical protein HY883_02005 [Deltaproteobacteria bacterium]|nr:hypothetical protein [Deltaproteobacteria bacterium]
MKNPVFNAGKVLFFSLVFFLMLNASAFGEELQDVKEELKKQKDVIERLENRVRELEERKKAEQEAQKEVKAAMPQFGMNLGAFGDLNFSTGNRERKNDSFSIGEVSLYSTSNIGERLNFLLELGVEFKRNESGEIDETHVDIERLWAGYTFSDFLIARAGRFHSALGYWNRAYHHGKHLFVTVGRPFFLNFEDDNGVIPIHIVGVEFSGTKLTSIGRFRYDLEAGNGPRMKEDSMVPAKNNLAVNSTSDDNNSKQVVARFVLEPKAVSGLVVGISGTTFTVEKASSTISVNEAIYGADVYFKRGLLEFIAEYFRFRNRDASANAYYLQIAYTLDRFTPYFRYETLNSDKDDPYLGALSGGGQRFQYIGGVKYDIDFINSSLKAQYRYDDEEDENIHNVFELQWAFHF